MRITRRTFLRTTGAGTGAVAVGWTRSAPAQKKQAVTIAFPEAVTTLDPQPAPRNGVRESMYEAVFDRYLQQDRQLKYHGHKKNLTYQPFPTGVLVPQEMSWA